MSDDDLLAELGEIARDEDDLARDPRWERRARGDLTPAEEAELRAVAASSRIGQAMLDAVEPAGADARDAFVDAILAAPRAAATVTPIQPRRPKARRAALGAFAAAVALAAGVALFVRAPSLSPVPDFDLVVSHGQLDQRSNPADVTVPRFGPGARVELTVRPHARVDGKVEARGALVREGEVRDLRPRVEVEISPDGAVHVEGTRESVFDGVPDGEWELWLAVGRPDALPAKLPAEAAADPKAARILRKRLILGPDR